VCSSDLSPIWNMTDKKGDAIPAPTT